MQILLFIISLANYNLINDNNNIIVNDLIIILSSFMIIIQSSVNPCFPCFPVMLTSSP